MSIAHIEKFHAIALRDPALIIKILDGIETPDDFVRRVVQQAGERGYQFTFEEAQAWIKDRERLKASGELSDSQLEAVAGGKGSSWSSSADQAAAQVLMNQATQMNALYAQMNTMIDTALNHLSGANQQFGQMLNSLGTQATGSAVANAKNIG